MNQNVVQQTLDAIIAAQKAPMLADPKLAGLLGKSTFSQSGSPTSGLTFYDLEAPAKMLYPVLTPLRNLIPRRGGGLGIQAAWRAITGINTGNVRAGVSGGNRGGVIAVATADYTASFKGIGLESNVDFEAGYAAKNFDDVRALAARMGLESLMLQEESIILGGNNSLALGTTPTPSASAFTSGGTLADAAYSVICVALAYEGFLYGSVTGGIQAQITRTNADSSSDTFGGGASRKSAAGAATVSGGSGAGKVTASVAAVNGASGYAWFWGASGSEVLGAITSINSVVITAAAAGTQTAASLGTGDNSQNSLIFDGLLTQAFKPGSNAYLKTMAAGTAGVGTPLTADSAGGITEINVMLQSMWDNYRLSPDTIWVSSQEQKNISSKIVSSNTSNAQRFVFAVQPGQLQGGGVVVTSYRNMFSMGAQPDIPIKLHPTLPAGTILVTTSKLPYPLANVPDVLRILTRQDYYQIEWPLRSRKYEYGVYADEVLQNYFPPSMGVINNIGNA
jgi:hypothetical protein